MKEQCNKKCDSAKKSVTEPNAEYIGEAIDIADTEKVTPELVKERTKTENNNPRDDN